MTDEPVEGESALVDNMPKVGEQFRIQRLAAGDSNAAFETNEIDMVDLAEGGDGIVYAGTREEAATVRTSLEQCEGMWRYHTCWKCREGEKPCVVGNPRQCEYPHARND